MMGFRQVLAAGVLCVCLMGAIVPAFADTPGTDSSAELAALLKEQNTRISGDLRRIQREIAALRADLDKPGMSDVFAGIGYILGLFGAAAFAAARRKG